MMTREEIKLTALNIVGKPLGDGALSASDWLSEEAADDLCLAIEDAITAALTPPEPTGTNRAENILREFEELHGQITIDERKWLRDRIATEFSPPEPTEGIVKALENLMEAAKNMPLYTPRGGGASTKHTYQIAASEVWALDRTLKEAIAALRAVPLQQRVAGQWSAGAPPMPWSEEWFIAETTFGDRVVLKALPKEWTYDFKTADDTYIKADKIKRWMQFPDSQFVDFVVDRRMVAEDGTK